MILALTAGLVSAFLTTASSVATSDKPKAAVSLGDSFISGEAGRWAGNGNTAVNGDVWGTDRAAVDCNASHDKCGHDLSKVYGDTAYGVGNGCDRSDVAEIKGADIPDVPVERRFNIACSGAITDNVTGTAFKGEKPQVERLRELAADYDITTIVLSISGNDLKFSGIIEACVKAYMKNGDPCSDTQKEEFRKALPTVKGKVIDTINKIDSTMQEAGYEKGSYRFILQSYPAPIPRSYDYRYRESADFLHPGFYDRFRLGGCPFLDVDTNWANDALIPSIRSMLSEVARTTNVSFLDLTNAFVGHELCTKKAAQATRTNNLENPLPAERAEWVRWIPYAVSQGTQGNMQEAIHPNSFGQQALSTCLTKMIAASPDGRDVFSCAGEAGRGPGDVTVSADLVRNDDESNPGTPPLSDTPTPAPSIHSVECDNRDDLVHIEIHEGGFEPVEMCFANAGDAPFGFPEMWITRIWTGNNRVQWYGDGKWQPTEPIDKYTEFRWPNHPGGVNFGGIRII